MSTPEKREKEEAAMTARKMLTKRVVDSVLPRHVKGILV
jgi:hypothetical protein